MVVAVVVVEIVALVYSSCGNSSSGCGSGGNSSSASGSDSGGSSGSGIW